MGTLSDFGQIAMKWDPKNLEIRTMSVEKTLEPLVLQVTTLVNTKGPSKKKKGKYVCTLCRIHTHRFVLKHIQYMSAPSIEKKHRAVENVNNIKKNL